MPVICPCPCSRPLSRPFPREVSDADAGGGYVLKKRKKGINDGDDGDRRAELSTIWGLSIDCLYDDGVRTPESPPPIFP